MGTLQCYSVVTDIINPLLILTVLKSMVDHMQCLGAGMYLVYIFRIEYLLADHVTFKCAVETRPIAHMASSAA